MNLLESLFLPQTNLGREFHKILNGNRIEADEKAKQIVKPDATRKKNLKCEIITKSQNEATTRLFSADATLKRSAWLNRHRLVLKLNGSARELRKHFSD